MPLVSGTSLGPYEIVAPLGAGGMGEVYRARDSRLARDVAVKVLPAASAADPERERRFEQEARAAAGLNHPNILHVYDVGRHDGVAYVVTELLDGETLRERLASGALPVRRAVDFAIAIAAGLAAAHEQGIVHRDLKPENLFITSDGRLKILDFGLAKLTRPDEPESSLTSAPTRQIDTAAGVMLGTVGYMSPEQVRGQKVDHRSDLFSFGAILYEMLSGKRAFHGESPADTMSAILREDPPALATLVKEMPPVLDLIVRHCLEKSPSERFRSAHDLAFQLEAISGLGGAATIAPVPGKVRDSARAPTTFRKLAFRPGYVYSARYAPDGVTVLYSAAWEGEPARIYMKRSESPESIVLPIPSADVHGISASGEVAIVLHPKWAHNGAWQGTLAVAPLFGGAPREIQERVHHAAFGPGGDSMVVAYDDERGKSRLEYPIGRLLYETEGHVSFPRFSPAGDRIAFFDHPFALDDRGAVAVVDLQGRMTTLTSIWSSAQGLAWSPSGEEIWFTASDAGSSRSLYGVTPAGEQRFISGFPGPVRILDVAQDGRVLIARDNTRVGVRGRAPGAEKENELSWLDWTIAMDLTPDGKTMLLSEQGGAVAADYLVCIRGTDGSPIVRLGEGLALAISPDARWVLARIPKAGSPLQLLPTGAGRSRTMAVAGVEIQLAHWLPDGGRILCVGRTPDRSWRAYLLHLNREILEQLPLEATNRPTGVAIGNDGRLAAVSFYDGTSTILPLDGGPSRPGPALLAGDRIAAFSRDGDWLFVEEPPSVPRRATRVHLRTGERRLWKELVPDDASGVIHVVRIQIAQDGEGYAYGYGRVLSELFEVHGLS